MATYTEIKSLFNEPVLRDKVEVACIIASKAIKDESDQTNNHANRLKWARKAFSNPTSAAEAMVKVLLAENSSLTVAQIQGASDSAIQTAVNNAINVFADGS